MKFFNFLMIALLVGSVTSAAPAFAQKEGPSAGWMSKFSSMTETVKVTVKKWWEGWTGAPPPPAQEPQKGTQTAEAGKPKGLSPADGWTPVNGQAPAPQIAGAPPTQPVRQVPAPPAPKPAETTEQAQLRTQPLFETRSENSRLEDVKNARENVVRTPVLSVATPGIPGTSQLPKSKAGVPVSDFKKFRVTKTIPRLDIGTENLVSAKDFTYGNLSWNPNTGSELQRLPTVPAIFSHELSVALRIKALPAQGPRGMQANIKTVGRMVTQETIDAIQYKLAVGEDSKPRAYKPFSEEELKMAAALILFNRGSSCHFVMGMFNQLARAPKTKVEATYHLGACADQMEMHQSAFDHLSQVVLSGDKDYATPALEMLAKGLPQIYEKNFYNMAKSMPNFKSFITDKIRDPVTYKMAKGAYRMGDFKTSMVYADQVSEKSDLYQQARVLSAMNNFAMGEKVRALKKLQELWAVLKESATANSNLRALVAVNIARMYFSQKKYDKALDAYMQVPKDHPFWVQALIEQGWTQLALEDYSGAIGNMYSLHSPYFKAVYQPDSFVVRTIGYLNICQYGDAYKTLTWMEKDYRDWFARMDNYLKTKGQPMTMYNTVKAYIKGKSNESHEGVPYQVWREMARQKDFLNMQTALNEKLDEARRYEGINEKIKKEKAGIRVRSEQAKRRFDELRAKIARLKVDKSLARELPNWQSSMKLEKELIMGLRFQLAILEQGRQGYIEFQKKSQGKLDSETVSLSFKAGQDLLSHAKDMRSQMSRVLDNNEFLRYEVFSGSGENIRYQVAGGEVSGPNRVPAHIKPTKMMNWAFDGEFWEDEIGSYRSSLQNNCPTATGSQGGRRDGEQARLGN